MTNRLAREKSPYLLQHAENPVDWYPWGDEAFAKARAEGKPIFLSIGYSTCHWCHVMEHESFEDAATAALMNELFVNIKVDREERPDVDRVYMTFVQATTGGGGWPMSVWLTPELQPFYGGTYFPPRDAYGRPGFPTLLRGIAAAWHEKPDEVIASGARIMAKLSELREGGGEAGAVPDTMIADAVRVFEAGFDEQHAGFGKAPKFPRPVTHALLLRHFARTGEERAAVMVIATLDRMSLGGMYDQLGGGFHRYSVDRVWHVPHFEKMLYDQAQLVTSYLEAYQVCGASSLADTARETCDYVLRDLTDPKTGGFFSAEDADSPIAPGAKERAEGAFYVFTAAEIEEVLGDAAAPFAFIYGVTPEGNAHDPHGELAGKNILHVMHSVDETAAPFGRSPAEMERLLDDARAKLFAWRARRPRPHLDDKILCAWNGMTIGALARAGRVLDEPRFTAAAVRAAEYVTGTLRDANTGELKRRVRDGQVAFDAYLEDYAELAAGLLELYETTFDRRWLGLALALTETQIALFADEAGGGFFSTTGRDPSVLLRMKDDYDGAEPSGNSIAAQNLVQLAEHFDRADLRARAEKTVAAFAGKLREYPHGMPALLVAHGMLREPPAQLVIAGERGEPGVLAFVRAIEAAGFVPDRVLILADAATRQELAASQPWLAAMAPVDGKPALYVCRNHACERPITDPAEVAARLAPKRLTLA